MISYCNDNFAFTSFLHVFVSFFKAVYFQKLSALTRLKNVFGTAICKLDGIILREFFGEKKCNHFPQASSKETIQVGKTNFEPKQYELCHQYILSFEKTIFVFCCGKISFYVQATSVSKRSVNLS